MTRRASLGLDHVSLLLSNLDEGIQFFHFLLGFPLLAKVMREDGHVAIFRAGRVNMEVWEQMNSSGHKEYHRSPQYLNHLAFEVRELEDLLLDLKEAGYEVLDDIFEPTDGVKEAVVKGPDGLRCKLVEQNISRLMWRSFSGKLKREEGDKIEGEERLDTNGESEKTS